MNQAFLQKAYTALLSAAVTFVAGLALKRAWKLFTGNEPPNPEDPAVPVRQAVTWFLASGVGVGVAQLFFHRFVADRQAKALGRRSDTVDA